MNVTRSALAMALLLVCPLAFGQKVITLTDDVRLNWRLDKEEHGKGGLCGFLILGNHSSREDPKVVWDISIDEVWKGSTRAAGWSAGSFDVLAGKRVPRPPIVSLSFVVEGVAEPIPTRIIGPPNADNGVRGQIDLVQAKPVFEALSEERWLTINLTYADQTSEILRTRGYRDPYHGGASSPFNACLRGGAPSARLRELAN